LIDIQDMSAIDVFDVRDDEHRHIITNLIISQTGQEIYKDDDYFKGSINISKYKMIITERGT